MTFFFRKKLKSLEESNNSLSHQSIKSLVKTVKVVKAFLILKYTKKIAELKEVSTAIELIETYSKSIEQLKKINHVELGTKIANYKLSFFPKKANTTETESDNINFLDIEKKITEHNKIQSKLLYWEEKLLLNKSMPHKRVKTANKTEKVKGLLSNRRLNTVCILIIFCVYKLQLFITLYN
jgi:hypothetical protein